MKLSELHGLLICGLEDGSLEVISSSQEDGGQVFKAHQQKITSLDIHDLFLVVGSSDYTFSIWTMQRSKPFLKQINVEMDKDKYQKVNCVQMTEDFIFIAAEISDRGIKQSILSAWKWYQSGKKFWEKTAELKISLKLGLRSEFFKGKWGQLCKKL